MYRTGRTVLRLDFDAHQAFADGSRQTNAESVLILGNKVLHVWWCTIDTYSRSMLCHCAKSNSIKHVAKMLNNIQHDMTQQVKQWHHLHIQMHITLKNGKSKQTSLKQTAQILASDKKAYDHTATDVASTWSCTPMASFVFVATSSRLTNMFYCCLTADEMAK